MSSRYLRRADCGASPFSTSSFPIFSESFLLFPLKGRFLNPERSELGRGLADSFFYGDALHAGCAHKAVDGRPLEDLLHIRGRGDGAAVAQHENIRVNRSSGFGDFLGLLCSLVQAHRFLCSYSATDGQTPYGPGYNRNPPWPFDEPLPDRRRRPW